jgi:hypothetical protein
MDPGRDEQELKRLKREGIRRRTRKSHEINREIKRRRARERAKEKREALQSDKYIHSFPSNPNPKAFFWWEKKLIFSDYLWADLPSASKTVYPILGGLCGQYGTTSVSQLRLAAEAGRSPRVIGEGVKGLVDQWGDIFSAEPRSYSHRSSRSSGHKGYTYHLTLRRRNNADCFQFARMITEGGIWSRLPPVSHALYPVMLALGKLDVEAYCHLEEDLNLWAPDFWNEGESSATQYAELRYFFCVATKNTLSELAGISYPSVKKALDRLERYRLVEHLGRNTWQVFVLRNNLKRFSGIIHNHP